MGRRRSRPGDQPDVDDAPARRRRPDPGPDQVAGRLPQGAAPVARGKALFASDEVGCTTCHGGKLYTDNATHELGGTLAQSDTPSLVGLARSAPYYHDGSAATLDALLAERAAVHGMAETVSLTAAQRQDLIAYLETL